MLHQNILFYGTLSWPRLICGFTWMQGQLYDKKMRMHETQDGVMKFGILFAQ
jgi:hypothetical protein